MAGKVLIVDDDPNIVGFVKLLLESEGYSTVAARNGKEALEMVRQHQPQVVLLDMVMPVMGGWEFSRQVRGVGEHDMAIIVMSASVDARKTSTEIGAYGYLAKPFDLDHLLECIGSVFDEMPWQRVQP
ncbi:MAG: response regulator [Chloroflexi bacterium]|nr:response regulator [Chloroflexota bacterium]